MAQATFANAVQKSAAHAAEISLQLLYIKHACESSLLATSSDGCRSRRQQFFRLMLAAATAGINLLESLSVKHTIAPTLTSPGSKGLQETLGANRAGCAKAH